MRGRYEKRMGWEDVEGERILPSWLNKDYCTKRNRQLLVEMWIDVRLELRVIEQMGACQLTCPLSMSEDYIQTRTGKRRSRSVYEPMQETGAPACWWWSQGLRRQL